MNNLQGNNTKAVGINKLPDMLNVLTILTFVGSGIAFLGLAMNAVQDCEKALQQLEDMPKTSGLIEKIMNYSTSSVQIVCENKLLLILAGLLGAILCIIGAVQMRKLKKQGFVLYVLGELISPVVMIILSFGINIYIGLAGLIVPMVFIILYATQRKYLIE